MKTLLEIKNADVYGATEARALVASLHEEFGRNPAVFHAIGLADIQVEIDADARYRRFFDIYSLATNADQRLRPLFESFGTLVWVLDDWRDVEADALNDHFNVFTPYRMDVPAQVSHLKDSFGSLREVTCGMLDPRQREELMISAGTTRVMMRYLDILA